MNTDVEPLVIFRCANCAEVWQLDELEPITSKRWSECVDEDDTSELDGVCPECGAFSYWIEPDSSKYSVAFVELARRMAGVKNPDRYHR